MAQLNPSLQGSSVPKKLTPSQKQWLESVTASMKEKINTQLEPVNDTRTPLQKALSDDHFLKLMNTYYDGVMQEGQFMQLARSQMPNFYALWVARRAELGRGPPLKKEHNTAFTSSLPTD
ncbi:hypothetical protein MJO28_012092 [Puccinia striiformis f. sp. tritici]|uniref:Uncharacterized protein n=4 Tax=Puccinia striiformis TaxID=27350 RepID=A0A2S4VEN3_9BASI|nr:hypothetical protein MJO28_012092 [Puccinia striiformis f. sp. tritici]KAI9606156.1 hypothetical protein H4Q26_004530 [Puccinia striiformis f. sp. tritici PST-130]KAI9611258.1 hypothetical protein KEM48_004584 [Puccinia striiformis f. sp. tritici PST-130]POW06681.1 hypothetical protein PSTT_08816 [Puccinia striiformis]POW07996.1 hypothetical protein PSHT_09734 [Puccinia striiformis]